METCAVELWTIPLTRECPTHLSEDEVPRANRFRFEEDRIRWIRARSSLRLILSRYAGSDPAELVFSYGKHGKPALVGANGVEFNLSHARDWAMVAVARYVPVGVDIERMRANVDIAALLRRLGETDLPQAETELYQAWTRREARTKAEGVALFTKPADDTCAIDIAAPSGYAASVALAGYQPVAEQRILG
jgi:4'-phosphopantetheinyl transferase